MHRQRHWSLALLAFFLEAGFIGVMLFGAERVIIGLAASVLALASAHWMVRDRERRDVQEKAR
jgi:hypothetical protein